MNRNGNVDLIRFFGSLMILICHMENLTGEQPYKFLWLYVEFFLIISGYYTAKHFDKPINQNANPWKEGLLYTLKKFLPFFPYILISTVFLHLCSLCQLFLYGDLTVNNFFYSFIERLPFDLLLITHSFALPINAPAWYLHCTFIVFPLICYLIQLKNRYFIFVFSGLFSVLYYGVIGVIGVTTDWRDFGRVIAGLLLGVFIYELTIIATDFLTSVNPLSLTIIEISGLTLPLVICIFPPTNSQITHFILLCFFMSLLPLLSQLSLSSKIKGNCITNYLGKLSMPIYIMHKCVEQTIILSFGSSDNTTPPTKKVSIAIYFLGSIILAMVTMRLVNKCKWAQKLDAKQK